MMKKKRVKGGARSLVGWLLAGLLLLPAISCTTIPYTDADKAEDLMDAGRYNDAVVEYSRSIGLLPTNPAPYIGRGYAYEKLGEYDKALADYTRVTELTPTDAKIFFIRGLLYDHMGKTREAIEDYSRSLLNQPTADAFYYRGLDWEKTNALENAIADYKRAAQMGGADAQAKLKVMGIGWQ
jgi:tetratricopeptide (TPR) repeat protein